jgi:hypothetical protein
LSNDSGLIDFRKTMNGGYALNLAAGSGDVTFARAVGNTEALASLAVTGTGITTINGAAVTTNAGQNYGESVILGNNVTLTNGEGAIAFAGAVDGAVAGTDALTIAAGNGGVDFDGVVGGVASLASLSVTGAGDIALNGGATSAGDVTLNGGNVSWSGALTGAGIEIFGNDIVMQGDVTSNSAAGVLMAAGNAFLNTGSNSIFLPGGGRFLIYSVTPANDIMGGLTGTYQFNAPYPTAPEFEGNGFLYSSAF